MQEDHVTDKRPEIGGITNFAGEIPRDWPKEVMSYGFPIVLEHSGRSKNSSENGRLKFQ